MAKMYIYIYNIYMVMTILVTMQDRKQTWEVLK